MPTLSRRGTTLLELMIGCALLVIVTMGIFAFIQSQSAQTIGVERRVSAQTEVEDLLRQFKRDFAARMSGAVGSDQPWEMIPTAAFTPKAVDPCATLATASCEGMRIRMRGTEGDLHLVQYQTVCVMGGELSLRYKEKTLAPDVACPEDQVPIIRVTTWPNQADMTAFTVREFRNTDFASAACFKLLHDCTTNEDQIHVDVGIQYREKQEALGAVTNTLQLPVLVRSTGVEMLSR